MELDQTVREELDNLSEELGYLQCDGLTTVLSFKLHERKIPHTVFFGSLRIPGIGIIEDHLWIEVGDRIVDYRARSYIETFFAVDPLLENAIPHGVFSPADYDRAIYEGKSITMAVDQAMYGLLIETGRPIEEHILQQLIGALTHNVMGSH